MLGINNWLFLLLLGFSSANGNYQNFEGLQWSHRDMASKVHNYINASDTNLSKECAEQLNEYSKALASRQLWALKMIDATSKITSGVLTGSTGDIGAFDQCLEIVGASTVGDIHGKYCLGSLNLTASVSKEIQFEEDIAPTEIYFAACFPSSCSAQELQDFYVQIKLPVELIEMFCQDKFNQPTSTMGTYIALTILGSVLGIMIVSTIYDIYLYYTQKETSHVLLTAFSMKKNGKTLLEVSNNPSHLLCLHGIRAISQMWIVLEHVYFASFPGIGLNNRLHLVKWIQNPYSMFIMGSSVVVDTFLLMGGLVVSYTYLNARAKGKPFSVLKHYAHRYIRLTPALGALILFNVFLLKHCGSGPYWNIVQLYANLPCKYFWWSALLYVQNYVNPEHTCEIQTWYLSVDMQLFLLSPLLLIPLYKRPKLTLTALGFLLCCTILSPFVVAWFFQLRRRALIGHQLIESKEYTKYYYHPTHTRAAPWVIGFILGYIIYKTKKSEITIGINKPLRQFIALVLWGVALAVGVTCIFCGHDLIIGEYDRLSNTLYIGLVKPLWSIAIAWIIFACVSGYGGPVNLFLSHPLFHFLSKVSYGMFLVHILIIAIKKFGMRTTVPFSNFDAFTEFFGYYMFSLVVATVWVLAFEYPWVTIDNYIFEEKNKGTKIGQKDKSRKKVA